MDGTLLETSSLLLPQEKIESLRPERRRSEQQFTDDVQQLTLFWKNFLNSTSEPTRVEWLELFMYKFEVLIREPGFTANNEQFLSSIPSHFICYLLKLVYTIISECSADKSKSLNADLSGSICKETTANAIDAGVVQPMESVDKDGIFNDLFNATAAIDDVNDANATQETTDLKTIVALRDFLAKGTGGRILRVLERLDLKGLLCSRELASVLVSFFPRSAWAVADDNDVDTDEVIDVAKLQRAVEELEFHTRFYFMTSEKSSTSDVSVKETTKKSTLLQAFLESTSNMSVSISECEPITHASQAFHSTEFYAYQQKVLSGDLIASTILNILQKLIENENSGSLVKTSATIKSLWFAVSQYQCVEMNRPFRNENHVPVKRKLLTIIYLCLNNIFPSAKRLDELFDVPEIVMRLMHAIDVDSQRQQTTPPDEESVRNLNFLVYGLFLFTQNVLTNRSHETNLLDVLFGAFQVHLSVINTSLIEMIRYDGDARNECMEKILHILLKLIHMLNCAEIQQVPRVDRVASKAKRRLSVMGSTSGTSHHKSYKLFKCTLESIVLHMAQEVKAEKLRLIFGFFQKYTICCCNIHLECIYRMLENSLAKKMHKICLIFVKQNVLRTIFNDDIRCNNCDTSQFIFKFKEHFVATYKRWFQKLDEPAEVIVFFKHIAKISKYLHVDLQSHILVDIVLPLFRREKAAIIERAADGDHSRNSNSEKILICCLLIFLCYLKDVTVIKAFFIEENIQHLEDMYVMPHFAYLVSNVLKIGIDNCQFLGETNDEREALSQRLETLQIQLFAEIIDILTELFNDVRVVHSFRLKTMVSAASTCVRDRPNRILEKFQSGQLSTFEIVHLSVVYWNSILQIIRSSHDEFRAAVEHTIAGYESIVFHLVYNSLSCSLFIVDPEQQRQLERTRNELEQKQYELNQRTMNVLNLSITSTLTFSDYEFITADELRWSPERQSKYNRFMNAAATAPVAAVACDDSGNDDDNGSAGVSLDAKNGTVQLIKTCDKSANNLMNSIGNDRNSVLQMSATDADDTSISMTSTVLFEQTGEVNDPQSNGWNFFPSSDNESELSASLIYRVRNAGIAGNAKMSVSAVIEHLKNGNSAKPNYNHIGLVMGSVQRITNFVSRKVFGAIVDLSGSASTANIFGTIDAKPVEHEMGNAQPGATVFRFSEQQLAVLSTTECKKLLMQLFEITLGVLICDYKEKRADIEMSNALQELKALLLSKSVRSFDALEHGASIVNALQSLLKVAEMRNKCCFFDDCAHPTLARQNKFSLNISLENDRLLLLTGQITNGAGTGGADGGGGGANTTNGANDFYGQSDGDTSETDNSYGTADEGYDADAEAAKYADTDFDDSDWSTQSTTVSTPAFRSYVVHEGICKIVIEILIDLSKRCLTTSTFCLNNLMQIATRLYSIRDLLGGSLYLLRGFAAVLEMNDPRLRDFQKSILDLITDLKTPDTLSAYLALMTSANPPLDLLLARFIYLGGHGQCSQPSIEIEFPISSIGNGIDDDVKHNCDPIIFESIKKVYMNHEQHRVKSPFTQSAYIAPSLNDFNIKPWTKDGFTITSWLRINSDSIQGVSAIGTASGDDAPTASESDLCTQRCVCKNKQHFLSIGTSSMVLSIYLCVTNVNTMYFQLSNPSAQLTHKSIAKSHSEHFSMSLANGTKKPKCATCASVTSSMKKRRASAKKEATEALRQYRKSKIKDSQNKMNGHSGEGTATGTDEQSSSSASKVLSTTINNTRLALKSSLSHFSLFSSSKHASSAGGEKEGGDTSLIGLPVEIKGVKLHRNRWTLFSMATCYTGSDVQLQICIDHSPTITIDLPCAQVQLDSKREKFSIIGIGHKYPTLSPTKQKDIDESYETNTNVKYSISNVLLFRKRTIDREILANLYALGPDCVNFAQCQIGNVIPNLGIPTTSKLQTTTPVNEVMRVLREHIALVYSAHQPNSLIGYNNVDEGEMAELIRFGADAQPKYVPSFQSALFLSGGLSSMLYLFARVVELSNSDVQQSSALQFFLKTSHSTSALYTEFVRHNYIGLLGAIIRSEKCLKTIRLLNSVLETACSGSVITKGPEGFELAQTKNVYIIYADLIVGIINHYSDWHCVSPDNCGIIEMLLSVVQSLVSEKHTYQTLNIARLNRAKLVPALFNFCKIHLIGGAQQISLTQSTAESMVNIIRIFAGAPPQPALLDDIIKVLLMLHRPSNSFITHDRSKFYFLLSPTSQQKAKKNNLPMAARKLSLSLRKSASNSSININSFFHRSNSLDRSTETSKNSSSGSTTSVRRSASVNKTGSDETVIELVPMNVKSSKSVKEGSSSECVGQLNVEKKSTIILHANDKAKFERALSQLNTKRQASGNKRLRKLRNRHNRHYQRQRSITEGYETDRDKKNTTAKRRKKRSVSDSGIDLALFREYDIIADEEVKRISSVLNFSCSDKETTEKFDSLELCYGIVHMQNGLIELLHDFILILPDSAVEEVLSHYVTLDIVLVLANNRNVSVRASIIRLLGVVCDRASACCSSSSGITKPIHFFHLGNQIALYPAEHALAQSCVHWVTGSFQSIDQLISTNNFRVMQKHGLSALIAIVPQTIHDINLARSVFEFLHLLYSRADADVCAYMNEIGLLPAVIKSLARAYIKWGSENDKLIDRIEQLLCTIALRALCTAGCINILWDLLNCITFIEQNKYGATYRGIRSTQATILLFLIKSFFSRQKNPTHWNFKMGDLNMSDCVLSVSEKRTRLELLLDRAVQFIRTANLEHAQTTQETKLIEAIVILSMSGFSRGSSIIPWSFLPGNPMPLKLFVIKLIWKHAKSGDLPSVGCDPKVVKTMIHAFWLTDREIIPKPDVDVLLNVCKVLGIQQTAANNAYIPQAMIKMELARENSLKEQKPSVDRTVYKFDSIALNAIESAMKITRYVVEIQNSERRNAMASIRVHDETCLTREWNSIIDRMTHEGAPWHAPRTYSNCWELDPTEGPSRVRIRMRRCHLNIPSRFFMDECFDGERVDTYKQPLAYLQQTLQQRSSCLMGDQVLYTFACKHLQVDQEFEGELIVTETTMAFIPSDVPAKDGQDASTIAINVNDISEVWLRRYQHTDSAMEFFLETNTSIFLVFQSTNDREMLKVYFSDKILQCPDAKLNVIQQQWREGQITNWEYLIALNLISGRTYQDLMQYPVFPWILSDYESATIDLTGQENYRNLAKPIAIQHSSNEEHYVNSYNYLNSLYSSADSQHHQLAPYHYGSHYSNSGTVLHFLVRIPPFTRYFLHYQDNNFDLPDRTFHSVLTTWRLASRDSTTDVKELIPEFFSFAEFLENAERFNFGIRQSGERVDNVQLPPWARDSSRLFIFVHRQALESNVSRSNLHRWIDLVFGWRQIGQPAVESINVFHPATYYGFSSSETVDPVERSAMETMVRTYGQMPRTLFKSAHPTSQSLSSANEDVVPPVLKHVKGLRWGCFTGSPELGDPRVCCLYQQFDVSISHLMTLPNTNVVYGFSMGHNVMQGSESDTMNIIQWKQTDCIVRIKPLRDTEFYDQKPLTYNHHIDEITSCGTDPNFNQLWFGHASGRITVYQCINANAQPKYNKHFHLTSFNKLSHNSALRKISMKFTNFNVDNENDSTNGIGGDTMKWKDPVILVRHTNTVTDIHISKEFKIVVSVANDGFAVIWDANSLRYVRSIQRPSVCKSPISLVTISPTLGDIVTVHDLSWRDGQSSYEDDRFSECYEATENIDDFVNVTVDMNGKSLLRVHTINAKYISHITVPEKILSCCYSFVKEGIGVNVIAAGLENGIVRLWSSWDLSLVREFLVSTYDVLGIAYSTHQHLVVLTSDNIIQVWDSPGLHGNPPKFPQVVFQKRNSV